MSKSVQFEYHVFPAVPPVGFSRQNLHNQAFNFWFSFWAPVLKNLDGTILSAADFFRQTWIGVVFARTGSDYQVVGFHTSTYFNLESAACVQHPYFQSTYEPDFVDFLRAQGARSLMTIEYLGIAEEFRRRSFEGALPISFIHVVFGLAFKLAKSISVDAVSGAARADLKVDQRAMEFGMSSRAVRTFHGVPVKTDYVLAQNYRECPHFTERMLIDSLWNARNSERPSYDIHKEVS